MIETLLGVSALLEDHGASLADLCQATAYCKTFDVYRTFCALQSAFGLKQLPIQPVLADVCRAELLFELDAVAFAGPHAE